MAERLVLCAGCCRHVKASEAICPFCGEGSVRPSTGDPFRRMAAAAAVAAGVSGLTACSSNASSSVFYGSATGLSSSNGTATTVSTATSTAVFYGSASIVPESDAGSTASLDGSGANVEDSSIPDSMADGGEPTDSPSDAPGDGPGSGEDAPSVVAFYGIATPPRDGEADGTG